MDLPPGKQWCHNCNGYGSSLHEEAPRCTDCSGTGLLPTNGDAVADSHPDRAKRPRA
jgi:DnaJ-class molecular chaperone